jgi:hypothetical protein
MLLFVYMGTVCGLVFWRMGDGTGLEAVRNRINVLFIQVRAPPAAPPPPPSSGPRTARPPPQRAPEPPAPLQPRCLPLPNAVSPLPPPPGPVPAAHALRLHVPLRRRQAPLHQRHRRGAVHPLHLLRRQVARLAALHGHQRAGGFGAGVGGRLGVGGWGRRLPRRAPRPLAAVHAPLRLAAPAHPPASFIAPLPTLESDPLPSSPPLNAPPRCAPSRRTA